VPLVPVPVMLKVEDVDVVVVLPAEEAELELGNVDVVEDELLLEDVVVVVLEADVWHIMLLMSSAFSSASTNVLTSR
jgi:hypothetical protein